MKFAVLTTTHKRPTKLLRTITSVRAQSYGEYTHYIVNDSPDYDYSEIEKIAAEDSNIVYTKNSANIGKNASLNNLLERLAGEDFNGFVVYLDDDDWLTETCLADFKSAIEGNPAKNWFVSNRSLESGESLTVNKTKKTELSYFTDYLFFKRFSGDATHCIKSSQALKGHYPNHIKNGEEWYYFLLVSKYNKVFLYINKNSTYTDGYSEDGLNTYMKKKYYANTKLLFKEKLSVSVVLYLCFRCILVLKRKYE